MEAAYVDSLGLEGKEARKLKGRGDLKLIQKTPLPRGNEDERVRNEWSYKARRCLKQARRCEQMTYRVQVLLNPEETGGPRHLVIRHVAPNLTRTRGLGTQW